MRFPWQIQKACPALYLLILLNHVRSFTICLQQSCFSFTFSKQAYKLAAQLMIFQTDLNCRSTGVHCRENWMANRKICREACCYNTFLPCPGCHGNAIMASSLLLGKASNQQNCHRNVVLKRRFQHGLLPNASVIICALMHQPLMHQTCRNIFPAISLYTFTTSMQPCLQQSRFFRQNVPQCTGLLEMANLKALTDSWGLCRTKRRRQGHPGEAGSLIERMEGAPASQAASG